MDSLAAPVGSKAVQYNFQAWKPILAFILFTLAIAAAGSLAFQRHKESIKSGKQHELGGIAELKIRQITRWMEERRGDVQAINGDPLFLAEVDRWLQQGGPADATRVKLSERLALLQRVYAEQGYTAVSLFDGEGMLRLSTVANVGEIHDSDKKHVLESMRSGQILFSDIHFNKQNTGERFEIELAAPLIVSGAGKAHTIGAILFNINPSRFLFPLIQRWPTPSASAESLLLRREGDEVVYLNELRHRKNTALSVRVPLSQQQVLSAKVAAGQEGLVEGLDYRGMPVVGVLNKIGNTSWYMVNKVDKAEIYDPINRLAEWVVALSLLFFTAGCGIFIYWWKRQRQHIRLLQRQYESDEEVRRLGGALKHSGEAIALADRNNNFIYINPAYSRLFGYSLEEVSGKSIFDLIGAPGSAAVPTPQANMAAGRHGLFCAEVLRRTKDGNTIPILLTISPIHDEHEHLLGYVAIMLDLSERKEIEATIRQSEEKYRRLFELVQEGIWVTNADSITTMVNPAMANMLGYTQEEMLGRHLFSFMDEQGKKVAGQNLAPFREGMQEQRDFEFMRKDGARIFATVATTPIIDSSGVCSGAIAGVMDVTGRKRSEMNLAESYRQLQQLSSHLDTLREDERTRIARELHDEMGATLAALKMRVAWLASNLSAGMTDLSEEAGHISGLVSDGIRTLRQIVTQLRPHLLEDLGFAAAVEDSVKKLRLHTGAECNLILCVDESELDADQAATLFRVIQESLSNVARHAQASHVDISLEKREGSLLLVVEDNGVGFGQEPKGKSFGLIGIRERAVMMGGKATVSSVPGKGTRVMVSIPAHAPGSITAHQENS